MGFSSSQFFNEIPTYSDDCNDHGNDNNGDDDDVNIGAYDNDDDDDEN